MGIRRGIPLRDRPALVAGQRIPELRQLTRHCWVQGPVDAPGPWPGVIVEWRKAGVGWTALVVYVITEGTSTTVVQTQVDSAFLRPAGA